MTTKDSQLSGPYATLSHKWGTIRQLRLKNHTLSAFQAGIRLEKLPKTFREAVQLTQRLKIRYLWIDSLCIIQDSKADWETESLRMEAVYSNCCINIAATISENSRGGLFQDRDVMNCRPLFGRITLGTESFLLYDQNLLEFAIEVTPLNSRAWVLQERILSPRVLHFAESQVLWECHTLDASEFFPRGLPTSYNLGVNLVGKSLDQERFTERWRELGREQMEAPYPYNLWYAVVTRYSKCEITNAADYLVAIGGLARRIYLVSKDKYLAGLWKSRLSEGLLWSTHFPAECHRSQPNRAPSWSWASIEGSVYWLRRLDGQDLLEGNVKSAEVVPLTAADPFGQIKRGAIQLADVEVLTPHKLKFDRGKEKDQRYTVEPPDGYIRGRRIVQGSIRILMDFLLPEVFLVSKDIIILPVLADGGVEDVETAVIFGLILRQVTSTSDTDTFERVGMVWYVTGSGGTDDEEILRTELEYPRKTLSITII